MDEERLDATLRDFLAARARATGTAEVHDLADRVRAQVAAGRPTRRAWLPAAVATCLVVGAGVAAGLAMRPAWQAGAPLLAEPVTTSQPWSFALDPSSCTTRPVPPAGSLPGSTAATGDRSGTGSLVVSGGATRLIDPVGAGRPQQVSLGALVATPDWPAWSPDGRMLMLRWSGSACTTVLLSADGLRAVVVPTVASEDQGAYGAAWSPDGRWLAMVDGSSIDVLAVDPDLRVTEARRVWTGSDDTRPIDVVWGPDGVLAFWRGDRLELVPSGASAPTVVTTNPCENPMAWAGTRLVCIGRDADEAEMLTFVDDSGTVSHVSQPVDLSPRGAKFLDLPLGVAAGRIYFTAEGDGWIDIYSVDEQGSDLRKITRTGMDMLSPDWIAPSPDGASVAFTTRADPAPVGTDMSTGLWVIDLATGDQRLIGADTGPIDWQAVVGH